jgi:hypothetical protein
MLPCGSISVPTSFLLPVPDIRPLAVPVRRWGPTALRPLNSDECAPNVTSERQRALTSHTAADVRNPGSLQEG